MPVAAIAVWLVVWRVKFSIMENVTGLVGLTLIVFAVAVFLLGPDWGELAEQALQPAGPAAERPVDLLVLRDRPVRSGDDAVRGVLLLLGSGRGGLDGEGPGRSPGSTCWSGSRSAACCRSPSPAAPRSCCCRSASRSPRCPRWCCQSPLPAASWRSRSSSSASSPRRSVPLWRPRCRAGYTLAQFFGWSWGKFRGPAQAARFHLAMIICLIVGVGVLLTGVDPIAGHRVLGGVLRGRTPADLPADPRSSPTTRSTWVEYVNGRGR